MITQEQLDIISNIVKSFLFEMNNQTTRDKITEAIENAFSEREEFVYGMCNEINNPPEVVAAGVLYVMIADEESAYTLKAFDDTISSTQFKDARMDY